jgi:hypothetical protein
VLIDCVASSLDTRFSFQSESASASTNSISPVPCVRLGALALAGLFPARQLLAEALGAAHDLLQSVGTCDHQNSPR